MDSTDSGSLTAGLFIKLDGEGYEIESVDAINDQFTLVEVSLVIVIVVVAVHHSEHFRRVPHLDQVDGAFLSPLPWNERWERRGATLVERNRRHKAVDNLSVVLWFPRRKSATSEAITTLSPPTSSRRMRDQTARSRPTLAAPFGVEARHPSIPSPSQRRYHHRYLLPTAVAQPIHPPYGTPSLSLRQESRTSSGCLQATLEGSGFRGDQTRRTWHRPSKSPRTRKACAYSRPLQTR